VINGDGPEPEQFTNTDLVIQGFSAFGSVTNVGGAYTITEAVDAGIFKTMALPIGAERLEFRYRFISGGDGDFLSVHWGTNAVLYVGPDLPISRTNHIAGDAVVSSYQNQTNELVFKLVSRGNTNAVVLVDSITLSINPDPDGDELTTDQEIALGTDPLNSDTDGDGLSDNEELASYLTSPLAPDTDGDGMWDGQEILAGTNPKSAASIFKMTSVQRISNGVVSLQWQSATNKLYRVNRSLTPTFDNYTTLTNNVASTPPLNSFTDTTATNAASFYWIELQ
jgi:hypothetical protein